MTDDRRDKRDRTQPDFITDWHEQHKQWPEVEFGHGCLIDPNTVIGPGTVIRNNVEIRAGVKIGCRCYIDSQVVCTGDAEIGDGVTLRIGVVVARGSKIGDECYLAPRVMFNNLNTDKESIGGALLGKRCFIGTHAVLHHGITIADGTVVGAMAFVNRDADGGTWIGCPARKS